MKKMQFKVRRLIITGVVATILLTSFAFTDNSFEISKNLDIFVTLVKELNTYYVDEIDPAKLVRKGIDEMLKSLDPYTVYIPESEAEDLRFMTTGSYGGIGAIIGKKGDYVHVSEPYENFPAFKAGLVAGDFIMEIDGKTTKGMSVSDVSSLLKGQANTEVKLTIKRPGQEATFVKTLVRAEIHVKNVPYSGMISGVINDEIGYINLSGFRQDAGDEMRAAVNDLKKNDKLKGIIIDLRNNPGGLLNEAVRLVGIFVNKGEFVVSTKGKVDNWNKEYKTYEPAIDTEIPLVVLVNGQSASASEIVAGALQDLDRAVIIGEKSYGKGLVQATRKLSYNAQLKLTTSKYYIPSGRCIQALDYTHKDEQGRAVKIADTLISEFKTKNGRKVFDGAGIMPDIKVTGKAAPEIVKTLVNDNLPFDFATNYRSSHESIPTADKFALSDKDYDDFIKFIGSKTIKYQTATEKVLSSLEKEAKNDKYFESIKPLYDSLVVILNMDKKKDLLTFRKDIIEIIEEEIVSRYYFQKGRIIYGIYHDEEIVKAKEVLTNREEYNKILAGTSVKK
jgi:carboxyl-terminal processing protease